MLKKTSLAKDTRLLGALRVVISHNFSTMEQRDSHYYDCNRSKKRRREAERAVEEASDETKRIVADIVADSPMARTLRIPVTANVDTILAALFHNSSIEVLFLPQVTFRQLRHLSQLIRAGTSKIWAVSLSQSSTIDIDGWRWFAARLQNTSVGAVHIPMELPRHDRDCLLATLGNNRQRATGFLADTLWLCHRREKWLW